MTILTPDSLFGVIRQMIDPINQIQLAGIDLTIDRIERFVGEGYLSFENQDRVLPITKPLIPDENNTFYLTPGGYQVRYNESVHIPLDAAGIVLPRSSLMRSGATLHSALWDPGYQGIGMGLITIHHPIKIQRNARIAQMIFITLSKGAETPYQGMYQGEGMIE